MMFGRHARRLTLNNALSLSVQSSIVYIQPVVVAQALALYKLSNLDLYPQNRSIDEHLSFEK